jgi:hypothetical protein
MTFCVRIISVSIENEKEENEGGKWKTQGIS